MRIRPFCFLEVEGASSLLGSSVLLPGLNIKPEDDGRDRQGWRKGCPTHTRRIVL